MTHAVQKWGRAQVDAQMGWDILFHEGLLYITGAIIYAVTISLCKLFCKIANIFRLAYQSAGDLVHSIFGATRTNSFIFLLFWGQSCISEASSLPSIMRMIRPHAVFVVYLEYQAEPQQDTIFSAARHRTKAPQDNVPGVGDHSQTPTSLVRVHREDIVECEFPAIMPAQRDSQLLPLIRTNDKANFRITIFGSGQISINFEQFNFQKLPGCYRHRSQFKRYH